MTISMIGTGNVGGVLGRRWAQLGHTVVFGTRDPSSDRVQALLDAAGPNASATKPPKAVDGADVVVLATPWTVTEQIVRSLPLPDGVILVDCTNPLAPGFTLTVGHDTSGGEQVARWAGGARVVKAFNTTGSKNMADPVYPGGRLTLFLCGDDAEAKRVVAGLGEALGFDVIDTGPLTRSRLLEPLAALWVTLAYTQGLGPDFGLAVLRR